MDWVPTFTRSFVYSIWATQPPSIYGRWLGSPYAIPKATVATHSATFLVQFLDQCLELLFKLVEHELTLGQPLELITIVMINDDSSSFESLIIL